MNNNDTFLPPGPSNDKMRSALAQAYALEGFREYLIFAMRIANANIITAVTTGRDQDAKANATRLETFRKLQDQAKLCFENLETTKKRRRALEKESLSTQPASKT